MRSRELGEGLRAAMERAGMSGRETAKRLGWSDSRVSRLLAGTRGGSEVDVSAFLAICGVVGDERVRLMKLCKEQHTPGWFQQHGSRLPRQVRALVDHETKAVSYSDFQPILVPGLLQTGDYARAVIIGSSAVSEAEIDDRVAARLARRNVFSRERPARFTFYIHEFALRLPIGGPGVMSDQLHEILRMSVRSSLTVRILPAAVGAYAATAGPFILMEFPEFKPVTYLETETSSVFLEEPEEIVAYRRILAALDDTALDEGQSRELIGNLAVELYEVQNDHEYLAKEQLQRQLR